MRPFSMRGERSWLDRGMRPRRLRRSVLTFCLLTSPALAQSLPPTVPGASPNAASPLLPGDMSRPSFDTTTPVYNPTAGKDPARMKVAEVEGRPITLAEVKDFIATLPPQVAQQEFQNLYPRVV